MTDSPDFSKCAGPSCYNQWHKMSEGKFFVFRVRKASAQSEVKKAWLCEGCFESWEVMLDQQGQVQLNPLMRMAS